MGNYPVGVSMRWAGLVLVLLAASCVDHWVAFAQDSQLCKYGLGSGLADSCYSRETGALHRVYAARTICLSANTSIQWNKKSSPEPRWAWGAIRAGNVRAAKGFRLIGCDHADLVVKYLYDDAMGTVKLDVTDAESGDTVFQESRDVSDLTSDVVRMAAHWNGMLTDAQTAARAEAIAAVASAHEQEEQAKREAEAHKCQTEFDSLKQTSFPIRRFNLQQLCR
jgi:hypothetical protein